MNKRTMDMNLINLRKTRMSFHLPTSYSKIDEQKGITQIKAFNKSSLMLFLSDDSIFIRESSLLRCPIKYSYTRTPESLQEAGINLWCEWITNNTFAFGTELSEVFILKISEENEINILAHVHIENAISSTFSSHQYLGLCTIDSKIILINPLGKITRIFELDGIDPLASAKFTYPDTLTINKNGTPVIIYLTKEAIENETQLIYNYEQDTNAVLIDYYQKLTEFAIATNNGSVLLAKAGSLSKMRFEVIGPNKDPVIFLKWIDDALLIIRESGDITMFIKSTNNTIKTKIPDFEEVYNIELDVRGQQLFYTTYEKVGLIYLSSIRGSLLIEPTTVKYGPNMKLIVSIEDSIPNEISTNLFPIQLASYRDSKTFAIGNKNGFTMFSEDQSSGFIKYPLVNMEVVGNYLVAFRKEKNNEADIYNFKGKRLAHIVLDHAPMSTSVVSNRLCVAGEFLYTIIDIVPKEQEVKVESVVLENNDKVAIYVQTNEYYIENVALNCYGQVLILDEFSSVNNVNKKLRIMNEGKGILSERNSGHILIQCVDNSYMYTKYNNLYSFKNKALMADSVALYIADQEIKFGNIQFRKHFWASYMFEFAVEDEAVLNDCMQYYHGHPDLPILICDSILQSLLANAAPKTIKNLQPFLSDDELAVMYRNAISRLRPEHYKIFYSIEEIQWERILPLCTPKWVGAIIANLPPNVIRRLPRSDSSKNALTVESFENPKEAIHEMCSRGAIFPAALFAEAFGLFLEKSLIDIESVKTGLIHAKTYAELLGQSETERFAKPIAEIAHKKKLPICELCALWIINDKKYQNILAKNNEFKKDFDEFMQQK